MTKRIFRSIFVVALLVFFATVILVMGALYGYFSDLQKKQLYQQTVIASKGVENDGIEFLQELSSENLRITWISADGSVIFDSDYDASEMENHLEREEIKEAIENGRGESERYSATLMERSLYSAVRLEDGSVLRVSVAQNTVFTLLLGMAQPIVIVFFIAVALSVVLALRLSKKIVMPLNDLNLDDPLSNDGYDELTPLFKRIDSQQRQLKDQSQELKRSQEEFDAVTSNMNEGLILLNDAGGILSMNRSAMKIFDASKSAIGNDILTVNRTLEMQELVSEALSGRAAEKRIEFKGREYLLDANPVMSEESVSGAVILVFDITEKAKSEALRREFTANVSHELKTPLHSISGYAELLSNGMVKPEDITGFSKKIYAESQRMIRLVEDIIKLSRLDEGGAEMKRENVDLFALANETLKSLEQQAADVNVVLEISGESAVVCGIAQLLYAIVFNLCDNAIKYNRSGGKVHVEVHSAEEGAVLSVSDTGIGIPAEHHSRVFERFYCVDKSHSKEVGGTGLGLSVVKHAAMIHDARIDLESTPEVGTTITVRFPKQ